jgi:putative CRISPR-associated protein (TIGR02620 family)
MLRVMGYIVLKLLEVVMSIGCDNCDENEHTTICDGRCSGVGLSSQPVLPKCSTEVLVVTRHQGLVDYLWSIGLLSDSDVFNVLSHVTASEVTGKRVIGVLPIHLAALAESVTMVPLEVPEECRGVELTLDQVRLYAGTPITYKVTLLD